MGYSVFWMPVFLLLVHLWPLSGYKPVFRTCHIFYSWLGVTSQKLTCSWLVSLPIVVKETPCLLSLKLFLCLYLLDSVILKPLR